MAFAFYKWIIILQLATQGSSQFLCPPAEIGSTVELICNHSNYSSIFFNTPRGPTAVACTPTCSDASRFTGSNINETQTRLTILKVEHRDRGTWTCQYGGEEEVVQCKLNLYKIPSCKISSDQDTNCLTLGQEITLYLNVNNTYCDEDNKLTMTSGDEVHIFTGQPGVNFSETFNTSYIVTDKHLGPVSSKFQCGNQILNISCSGVTNLQSGSSQFLCPPAEIGSSVELTCNHSNSSTIFFNTPRGFTAVDCTPTCSDASRFTGSNINETQTRLTILKVEHRDGGTWTCQYGGEVQVVQCNLNLYNIPSCKISSDQDTNCLTLGQEITLYLNVKNSYCDEHNKLTMTSGDDVQIFTGRPSVNFSETFNTSYIVTDKHLGPVRSKFQCGNQILNISCSGVTKLQRETPTCKITSDTDTSNLEIGDNITLSLTVNNTYCTDTKTTSLTTGKVVQRSPEQSDENITEIVVYQFTITVNHLGPVESVFQCGDKIYTLNCDGVRTLKLGPSLAQKGDESEHRANTTVIIAVVVSFTAVIVIVVIVVVVVYRRGKHCGRPKTESGEQHVYSLPTEPDQPQLDYNRPPTDFNNYQNVYSSTTDSNSDPHQYQPILFK